MPRGKRKVGRPEIKLTDDIRKRIVNSLLAGMPRTHAAAVGGVSPRTFARWLARGSKARSGIYRQLCLEVAQAEAAFVGRGLKTIYRIAEGDAETPPSLQAWTWLLSRRFPKEFGSEGRATRAEVKGEKGGTRLVLIEGPAHVEPPGDMP